MGCPLHQSMYLLHIQVLAFHGDWEFMRMSWNMTAFLFIQNWILKNLFFQKGDFTNFFFYVRNQNSLYRGNCVLFFFFCKENM